MGKVRPAATRMRPPDSFCAARWQQQKRFNVRPFKKSWDTRIFQISFIWLGVLTSAYSCSHRWGLLRINCESTYSRPLDVSATNSINSCSPRFDNIQYTADWILTIVTTHNAPVYWINLMWSWQVCRLHPLPTSHTLHLYPLHPSPTFPLSKLYCWKLRNSPWPLVSL